VCPILFTLLPLFAAAAEDRTAFPLLRLPTRPNGTPDDFERYQREQKTLLAQLHQHVLPDLPPSATLVQRVRYEQAREALTFSSKTHSRIECGAWDVDLRDPFLTIASEAYRLAAELNPAGAGRRRCLELRVLALKYFEQLAQLRGLNEAGPLTGVRLARSERLAAEADLLAAGPGAARDESPKPAAVANPERRLGPGGTAVPELKLPPLPKGGAADVSAYREQFNGLLFAGALPPLPETAPPIQRVRHEQVAEGLAYLKTAHQLMDVGRWDGADQAAFLKMTDAYRLAAGLQTTPADRVRCHESRVLVLKDFERFTTVRVETGNAGPQALNLVRFYRLEAEADLLEARAAK
jgi:hypothetical protein